MVRCNDKFWSSGKRKPKIHLLSKPMIEGMNLLRSHAVKQQQNQQGGISDNTYETNPRMYATNEADCPVQALRKYLSKRIPTTDHFVQLSVQTINDRDLTWYTSRPIWGKNVEQNDEKHLKNGKSHAKIHESLCKGNHCAHSCPCRYF